MNSELEIVFAQEPSIVVLGELEVATLSREDWPRAARLLEEEHYLGDTRPVGRTMPQTSISTAPSAPCPCASPSL